MTASPSDAAHPPLPQPTRAFIVLIALLQGLLLYLAQQGAEHRWWPFDQLNGRIYWYTLVLSVPTVMSLTVQRLNDARFWQHAIALSTAFGLLAAWAAWSVGGAPGIESSAVLSPFATTLAIALFIATPYLQCRLQHGRWRAPYAELFEHAWQNALTLALALLFVGICWGVLELWGRLFKLIGIDGFDWLFDRDYFIYPATGLMAGLGVLIGRTQQRPVQVARQIMFAIFKGLLPLLSAIAVLFVVTLPFTGLEALWKTRSAASILMSVIALLVLFVNAVYQDGEGERPYPAWLRRIVEAALIVSPIYAVLGLYALWLRIAQYGWTSDRFWAVLLAILLTGYAFGYAYSALRSRTNWLRPLAPVNVGLSWIAIALAVIANSPVLDPHRLIVNDQLARLHDGRTAPDKLDLNHLRFTTGRRGYEALQALRQDPLFASQPTQLERLQQALNRKGRWSRWRSDDDLRQTALASVDQLRGVIRVAPGVETPEPAFWQALLNGPLAYHECNQPDSRCVLLTPDLDGDGSKERLLCSLGDNWGVPCRLYAMQNGRWAIAGKTRFSVESKDIEAALLQGRLETKRQRWAELEVNGKRGVIDGSP